MHDDEPVALLNEPSGHDRHADWPVSGAYDPGVHDVQLLVIVPGEPAYDPVGHGVHSVGRVSWRLIVEMAPTENFPTGQLSQAVTPAVSENLPGGQFVHVPVTADERYFPAVHVVHDDTPSTME